MRGGDWQCTMEGHTSELFSVTPIPQFQGRKALTGIICICGIKETLCVTIALLDSIDRPVFYLKLNSTLRGLEPSSYRGALVSTLLHATVYMFLHNLLNVLVQIANTRKIRLQMKLCRVVRTSQETHYVSATSPTC
jgi:hypothetical protein